jgi:hypothetical protein
MLPDCNLVGRMRATNNEAAEKLAKLALGGSN